MLTERVAGFGSAMPSSELTPHRASLFCIVYPPPRTPNLPATAGIASTAAIALPPLRLRSMPQPVRITAGELAA